MIIFINGSINSGKSTVAKTLAEKLGNTAVVEIDSLCEFIDWMPLEKAIPINLENAVSVIRTFVRNGLHVVIPYPLSKRNYDYVSKKLSEFEDQIQTYTLDLEIESALTNRGTRELSDWERDRIRHHYASGITKPEFGVVIDTNLKSVEEVANCILAYEDNNSIKV
jgi:cytidylate kinase